jgi:hypothetical protein
VNVRTTAILALVAVVLGVYVWLVEVRGAKEREEEAAAANRILGLDGDAITAMEVPLEGGGEARMVRDADDPDRWTLESPVSYPADASVVSGIVSALTELEPKGTIDDPPEDLAPFGLAGESPAVRVFTGEDESRVLRIGEKAPVGALTYVRRDGDERVFTVEDWRMSSLRPRLVSLRDKRLLSYESGDVTEVKIWDRDQMIVRAKASGSAEEEGPDRRWDLVEPIEDRGDARRFQRLLDDLHFLRATDFVDEPGDLAAYGLHRPEIAIELDSPGGREQIEMGRKLGKVYARTGRHGIVFEIADRALADVPRDLFAYRHKQVVELDEDRAARIELYFPRDLGEYGFVRQDNEWKAEQEGVSIGSLRIEDILYAVRDLEATGLEERSVDLAKLGLEPAGVRVTIEDGDGNELGWVEFGDPSVTEGLPARSSESDKVWRVENEVGKDVPLTLEAFRNNFLVEETPPAAEDVPAQEAGG